MELTNAKYEKSVGTLQTYASNFVASVQPMSGLFQKTFHILIIRGRNISPNLVSRTNLTCE